MRAAAMAFVFFASNGICGAAQASVAADDPVAWRHLAIAHALNNAEQIADPYRRAEVQTSVAKAQALIDEHTAADRTLHLALESAQQIAEPAFQGWVLHEIVLVQLAADDLVGARATAERIRSERPQGAALLAIAVMQIRAGNLEGANRTAVRIEDDDSADQVRRQIVLAQVAGGEVNAARATLRRIDDDFYRAQAAGDIAVAEVRAGDMDGAHAMALSIRRAHRAQVYERIAVAQADAGSVAPALATAQKIETPIERALVQGRIAARLHASGNRDEAQRIFAAATTALLAAKDGDGRKAVAWSHLARMKIGAGDEAGAEQNLVYATAAVAEVPAGMRRDAARDAIARSQIKIGNSDAALALAAQIDDRIAQALLIRDIIASQAGSGSASALLGNEYARKDALTQAAALFGVIGVQLLRKDEVRSHPQVVGSNVAAARAAVRSITEFQVQPAAFAALAAAQATIGDVAGGSETFGEALQAASALPRPEQRAAAFVRIVNALDERLLFLGQPARSEARES